MSGYSTDLGMTQVSLVTTEGIRNGQQSDQAAARSNSPQMNDYLWLAAPNEGLRRFHFASGTWTTFKNVKGLLHNHVGEYGLAVDEDYVWVGTVRGLSRYHKQKESWTPLTALPTLVGRTVRTVDTDERFVWAGTGEGMSRYDKVLGTWKKLSAGRWIRGDRNARGALAPA